jgi:hypothetical protein
MMAPNSLRAVLLLGWLSRFQSEVSKLIWSTGLLPLGVISSPAASTLYLDQKHTEFSINVANDSNDTYFHFESPFQDLWVAVGVGAEMKGALMFIMYPSKDNQREYFSAQASQVQCLKSRCRCNIQPKTCDVSVLCFGSDIFLIKHSGEL